MDAMGKLALLVIAAIVGGLAVIYFVYEGALPKAYESEYGEQPPGDWSGGCNL